MQKLLNLILLLFCLENLGYAQLKFKNPNNIFHFQIDLATKELFNENIKGEWNSIGRLTFSNIDLKDIPSNPTVFSYSDDQRIILTFEGTGQVYELNVRDLRLRRLDKTFFRGYNFAPIQFFRKDTINSMGGNGFWHAHNIETYFSFKSNEWELKNIPTDFAPRFMNNEFGGYDAKRDLVSIIECQPLYHQERRNIPLRYFEKNMKFNHWTYLGNINTDYLFSLGLKSLNSYFVLGNFLFLNGSKMVWADPEENKIYQLNEVDSRFNHAFEYSGKNKLIYIYYHEKLTNQNQIDSISIDKLKSLSTYKGPFYIEPYPTNLIGYGAVAILILSAGGIYAYRKRKPRKAPESFIEPLDGLPAGASEFLLACLNHPQGHAFSSQHFTEMMGYGSYAYETQRQVRAKLIKGINSYFWAHYRMDDVIIRQTANDDKRFSVYLIAESHYDTLKKLLNV